MPDLRNFIDALEMSPSQKFVDFANVLLDGVFFGEVTAMLSPQGNSRVEIDDLYAEKPGKGWGSKVMATFCDLADHLKVVLSLEVATDEEGEEDADLIAFYERFGFDHLGEGRMTRTPYA